MITLFNRLLQTEKRRICILFCAGCACAAVFAFANARMGYLLVQLRSIEDVLALTHHPWVEGTWLGRTILNLLATPLAFSDWLSSAVTALAWPQIGFLLVAAIFFTQRGKDKNLRRKRRGLGCLIGCELVMVIAGGFFVTRSYFSLTTLKAIQQFAYAGIAVGSLATLQLVLALIQIPLALYRDFLAPENVKS